MLLQFIHHGEHRQDTHNQSQNLTHSREFLMRESGENQLAKSPQGELPAQGAFWPTYSSTHLPKIKKGQEKAINVFGGLVRLG
jgi:hypothetical protein